MKSSRFRFISTICTYIQMKDVQKPEGPQQDSPWIIVTTLDGHLRALNIDTGKELWDLSDAQGPLIQDQWSNRVSESDSDPNAATSSETSLQEYRGPGSSFSEGPVYIVEPKQHGRLYVYQKAQPIRVRFRDVVLISRLTRSFFTATAHDGQTIGAFVAISSFRWDRVYWQKVQSSAGHRLGHGHHRPHIRQ